MSYYSNLVTRECGGPNILMELDEHESLKNIIIFDVSTTAERQKN